MSKPYIPAFDSKESKYYVYFYIDPRNGLPFYIGKGNGQRAYVHLRETKDNTENKMKHAYIKGLRNKELEPIIEFIFTNQTEDEAKRLEKFCIQYWGRKSPSNEVKQKMSLAAKGRNKNGQSSTF